MNFLQFMVGLVLLCGKTSATVASDKSVIGDILFIHEKVGNEYVMTSSVFVSRNGSKYLFHTNAYYFNAYNSYCVLNEDIFVSTDFEDELNSLDSLFGYFDHSKGIRISPNIYRSVESKPDNPNKLFTGFRVKSKYVKVEDPCDSFIMFLEGDNSCDNSILEKDLAHLFLRDVSFKRNFSKRILRKLSLTDYELDYFPQRICE